MAPITTTTATAVRAFLRAGLPCGAELGSGEAMVFLRDSVLRNTLRVGDVAAAQRADQCDLHVELARLQVDELPALAEHAGLGVEDREVAGDARLVALRREIVGGLRRGLRARLLAALQVDGA